MVIITYGRHAVLLEATSPTIGYSQVYTTLGAIRVSQGFGADPRIVRFNIALRLTADCARQIIVRCEQAGCVSSYSPLSKDSPPNAYLEVDRIGFPEQETEETDLLDLITTIVLEEYANQNPS